MQDQVQLTRIKLKIIEGRPLTDKDAEYLTEGMALMALGTWLVSQATPFLKKELRKQAPKLIAKYDLLKTIDRRLAQSLGREREAVGSVLTAYVMSLVDSGSTVEAAMNIGKLAAQDIVAMKVAQGVQRAGETTLAKQQADKVMDRIEQLEPQATQVAQNIEQSYQDHVMAGDEDYIEPDQRATQLAQPQKTQPQQFTAPANSALA